MPNFIVAVGSTRKPKLNAVAEALRSMSAVLLPGTQFEIVGREMDSCVGHTPLTREELMRGARHRAGALVQAARQERAAWTYFVGLEGGLDVFTENGTRRVFLESWAYVTDGTRGYFGRSGAIELPEALADEVVGKGIELSVAIDKFAGEKGVRDAQGAWGVLTRNLIARQEAFRVAVIAAFAPFYNEKMYREARAAT